MIAASLLLFFWPGKSTVRYFSTFIPHMCELSVNANFRSKFRNELSVKANFCSKFRNEFSVKTNFHSKIRVKLNNRHCENSANFLRTFALDKNSPFFVEKPRNSRISSNYVLITISQYCNSVCQSFSGQLASRRLVVKTCRQFRNLHDFTWPSH